MLLQVTAVAHGPGETPQRSPDIKLPAEQLLLH
jgi:hypothetical protein